MRIRVCHLLLLSKCEFRSLSCQPSFLDILAHKISLIVTLLQLFYHQKYTTITVEALYFSSLIRHSIRFLFHMGLSHHLIPSVTHIWHSMGLIRCYNWQLLKQNPNLIQDIYSSIITNTIWSQNTSNCRLGSVVCLYTPLMIFKI